MVNLITESPMIIPVALLASVSYLWVWRRRQLRSVSHRARRIDPIGEAEVFLAYGRSKDALRVLRTALNQEPGNLKIKVVMLRALAELNDVPGFIRLASEVQAPLSGQPVWQQICKTGQRLQPENPLFR